MIRFNNYLVEQQNTHMEHLEDSILNAGVDGAREAINFLRSLRDMLSGSSKSKVDVTVKWDGAPAIFAGKDPADKKFFVAKKGIFNKNPMIYKTYKDIDNDIAKGDLNTKMKLALKHLPALNITGVVQGDFLYAKKDLRKTTIDGESYITFHPNTIVYAIPEKSKLARQILGSQIGVVWHTTYRGRSFETMSASFGKEIASKLSKNKNVWSVDALYKDVSGNATMTETETDAINAILSKAGKKFTEINKETFQGISDNEELSARAKVFTNVKVRAGETIDDTDKFVSELMTYLYDFYQAQIDKLKTEKGKARKEEKRKEVMAYFSNTDKSQIVALFDLYNLIAEAKLLVIKQMDKAKTVGTFFKTADGYQVTGEEGFVAIDKIGTKNAVKLVDRMKFSRANFDDAYIKGWN